MLSSLVKPGFSHQYFSSPYFIHTDPIGVVQSMCDRMEELIRQTSCRDYQDQSIAQIFSMLGDSILLQTDLEEKGFPSSFDTALFIHPAFRPLYFRWISNPILDRGKISGWQLTGVEFNIPAEQSATFLPERKNVESTREHKNLY